MNSRLEFLKDKIDKKPKKPSGIDAYIMEESEAWGNAAWMDVQIRSSWRSVHEAWTMEQRSNDAAAKDAQM